MVKSVLKKSERKGEENIIQYIDNYDYKAFFKMLHMLFNGFADDQGLSYMGEILVAIMMIKGGVAKIPNGCKERFMDEFDKIKNDFNKILNQKPTSSKVGGAPSLDDGGGRRFLENFLKKIVMRRLKKTKTVLKEDGRHDIRDLLKPQ